MDKVRAHATDAFVCHYLSVLIVRAETINMLAEVEIESVITGFYACTVLMVCPQLFRCC